MRKFNLAVQGAGGLLVLGLLAGLPEQAHAQAADAAVAWGTMATPGQQFVNSALLHEAGGTIAQQVEAGPGGGSFNSVTSCGTCTTITITGDDNTVSGNSITSTNFGTVSSTGIFNFDQ